MMIFYFFQLAYACYPLAESINLYPTIGQQFSLPLSDTFQGNYLTYKCTPRCPDSVQIRNSFNQINQQQVLSYMPQALSSNTTHFATLSNNMTLHLYYFSQLENEMMLLTTTSIHPSPKCYNTIFTLTNLLLIDCYQKNGQDILDFYYLNKSTMILLVQFKNQSIPLKTKMLNFQSNNKFYLLYAQFYDEYQILSLFDQESMGNITTWKNGFTDFAVSTQFIYIIHASALYQVFLNQYDEFLISEAIRIASPIVIQVQNFKFFYSQCDFVIVIQQLNQGAINIIFNQAVNGSFFKVGEEQQLVTKNVSRLAIYASEQFLIIQQDQIFISKAIGKLLDSNLYKYSPSLFSLAPPFGYLNQNENILFLFGSQIEIFQLEIPRLIIYNDKNYIADSFFIRASQDLAPEKFCQIKVNFTAIAKDNNSIFVAYSNFEKGLFYQQNSTFTYQLKQFSGPLLKSWGVLESQIGSFKDKTKELIDLNIQQEYTATGIFAFGKKYKFDFIASWEGLLFVGTKEQRIYFFICTLSYKCHQIFSDTILSPIDIIKITYSYPKTILVGVNQGFDTIYLYNISNVTEVPVIIQSAFQFSPYKQFILTYNNIILLLETNEILIQSLESSDNLKITSEYMDNLLSNYSLRKTQFTPQNIEMNTEDLSSILYINNNNTFIILMIYNTKLIIPQSINEVNLAIYKINIIKQQLIISYKVNQSICFQVWNVSNLLNPQYFNDLPSLSMKLNVNIQSDNLFLYIQNNGFIYVLNPQLSYHNSLYYKLRLNGTAFSSFSMGTFSIISCKNSSFKLNSIILQEFTEFNSTLLPYNYITSTEFYFSAYNQFDNSVITTYPPQVIFSINSFTKITFLQDSFSQNFTSGFLEIINITSNKQIRSYGQIIQYSIFPDDHCRVDNIMFSLNFSLITNNQTLYDDYIQYSQLHVIDEQIWLQIGLQFMLIHRQIMKDALNGYLWPTFEIFSQECPSLFNCNTTVYQGQYIYQLCQCQDHGWFFYSIKIIYNKTQENFNIDVLRLEKVHLQHNITNVNKMMQINDQYFMLLVRINNGNSQLCVLNLDDPLYCLIQKVTCHDKIVDFTNIYEQNYTTRLTFILFICSNSLSYYQFQPDVNDAILEKKLINSEILFLSDSIKFSQILLLRQAFNELLFLITTSKSLNIIFTAEYKSPQSIRFKEVAQTIPSYKMKKRLHNMMKNIQDQGIRLHFYQKPQMRLIN